jgi:hypothetical protein
MSNELVSMMSAAIDIAIRPRGALIATGMLLRDAIAASSGAPALFAFAGENGGTTLIAVISGLK